jgi:hypothetical protein
VSTRPDRRPRDFRESDSNVLSMGDMAGEEDDEGEENDGAGDDMSESRAG